MADVQPEHGTAPIAYALLEALSRDPAVSISGRVLLWVLRNTYGRRAQNHGLRRKTCTYSWAKIAEEIAADRSDVSRAGRRLLASKRLVLDAREHIGLQKDYEKWGSWGDRGQTPRGIYHRAKTPRSPGQKPTPTVGNQPPYKERARAVVAVQSEGRGVLPAPARPANGPSRLPNGAPDTLRNRAELGHELYAPDEHPDYARADFKARAQHQADWETAQRQRENDARAAAAKAETNRIQADIAKREAEDAALSPEQKKANAQALEQMKRELREKRYGRP